MKFLFKDTMDWQPIYISVCIVLVGAALSDACSCRQSHPQTHFCDSQYVFQASILTQQETEDRQYIQKARVFKVFKAPENSTILTSSSRRVTLINITTPIDDGLCGVKLRRRVKYALTGRASGSEIVVDSCDMIMEWAALTVQETKGLHRKYQKNCHCKVEWCHGSSCRSLSHDENTTCLWNTQPQHSFCYEHHGICQETDSGCDWMKPNDLRSCITETLDDGSGGGEP